MEYIRTTYPSHNDRDELRYKLLFLLRILLRNNIQYRSLISLFVRIYVPYYFYGSKFIIERKSYIFII